MGFVLGILLAFPGDSPYLARELDRITAEYLAVAPPAFADRLDPLLAHRAKRFSVALVRTDDVAAKFGKGPEGIRELVSRVKPRYLLLAGDADAVPAFVKSSEYTSETFASDADLATDHLFGAMAGRLPADTADELGAMVEKTIEYETSLPAGAWQKKVNFITGEGGFGAAIDALLERQFGSIVTAGIPAAYDVEIAYAKTTSTYGYYPPKFNEQTLRLLNEGSLFTAYVGHGMRTCFDDVRYQDSFYPILEARHVREVEVRAGLPILVVIACNTGEFDNTAGDCIGEQLVKRPRGPVAFIGGTRTTQPYANALFGRRLVEEAFDAEVTTLGEALWRAKAGVVGPDDSFLRRQADLVAGVVQGPGSLEKMRKDVILHYNLLGDPALLLRRPDPIEIEPPGPAAAGRPLVARGSSREERVEVTFECARDAFCRPVDLVGEDAETQLARRYANANNKVIVRTHAVPAAGRFEAELALPAGLKPGRYFVKVHAGGAASARAVDLR